MSASSRRRSTTPRRTTSRRIVMRWRRRLRAFAQLDTVARFTAASTRALRPDAKWRGAGPTARPPRPSCKRRRRTTSPEARNRRRRRPGFVQRCLGPTRAPSDRGRDLPDGREPLGHGPTHALCSHAEEGLRAGRAVELPSISVEDLTEDGVERWLPRRAARDSRAGALDEASSSSDQSIGRSPARRREGSSSEDFEARRRDVAQCKSARAGHAALQECRVEVGSLRAEA